MRSVLLMAVVLLTGVVSRASEGPPPTLNIKTYTSPSGEYALTVDPSGMYGQGKGSYRMVRNGAEVWAKELQYTLWEACVTDAGEVAGYAYTRGWRGIVFGEPGFVRGHGDFVVAILDAAGEPRLARTMPRDEGGRMHGPPDPVAAGCFSDPAHDRFVVRFRSEQRGGFGFGERWTVYTMSTGASAGELDLQPPEADAKKSYMPFGVQPIPVTGLTLVLWSRTDYAAQPFKLGLRLALVDKQCAEVWNREWPDEFVGIEHFSMWDVQPGELTPPVGPGQFAYRSISEQVRLTFDVSKDDADGWKVQERVREPDEVVLLSTRRTVIPHFPPIELRPLGSISLNKGTADAPALDLGSSCMDGAGRIGFVSYRGSGPYEFTLVDPADGSTRKFPLGIAREESTQFPGVVWVGGTRWIFINGSFDDGAKPHAIQLDIVTGTLTAVEGFDSPMPTTQEGVAAGGDQGFTVIGDYRDDRIASFAPSGQRRWQSDATRFSPRAAAMQPDGSVGVLVGISNQIMVFDRSGETRRTIELNETVGRLNYVAGLMPDDNGGWILHDFNGNPPIYRLDAEGKPKSSFTPKYEDGRTFRIVGEVQRAPDGRLWTSDGAALLRLTDDGIVDRVLGRPPTAESLDRIRCMTVDHRNRIYAVDNRSGVVQMFDAAGVRLGSLRPEPTDFQIQEGLGSITVAGDGSVYVQPTTMPLGANKGYLKFDGEGKRVGFEPAISEEVSDEWFCRPGGQERLVLGYSRAFLVDKDGKKTATMERRADRKWLENPRDAAVAADGSFVIVAAPSSWFGGNSQSVTFFSPDGAASRTIELEGPVFPRVAYNGRTAAVAHDEHVWLFDRQTGAAQSFKVPGTTEEKPWYEVYFSADGTELWLRESTATEIQRYAMP